MTRKWTEFVIGIILIISPWILGFSDISVAEWCNVLVGLLLVLIAAWELFGGGALLAPAMLDSPEPPSTPRKKREPKHTTVEK